MSQEYWMVWIVSANKYTLLLLRMRIGQGADRTCTISLYIECIDYRAKAGINDD